MIINCKSQVSSYCQREGAIARYFNDIRKYPMLTKSEEKRLISDAQGKNTTKRKYAIEKLVNCNQRFVASAALKYANGNDLMDLINEANIGLITAIERFDNSKDVKFITYAAFWIQKSINAYITNLRNIVVPPNANKLKWVVNKVRHEFYLKEDRNPTLEEIQEILKEKYNFNVENLCDLETFQTFSIENCNDNGDDENEYENSLYSQVTSTNNIDEDMRNSDYKRLVGTLLNKLNERDRFIIESAFGIGRMLQTYDAIAEELSLTKERIRQKINEITKRLGKYLKEDIE